MRKSYLINLWKELVFDHFRRIWAFISIVNSMAKDNFVCIGNFQYVHMTILVCYCRVVMVHQEPLAILVQKATLALQGNVVMWDLPGQLDQE